MSYGKEIGQILAEEVLELVLSEELELLEIRDLDTLGTHITKTETKLGKSHAKTKALKRLYKRKSGIEGIRNFKPAEEMDEAELQEIRGLERLRQEFNKNILRGDPDARQRAMRLQALQARKLRLGQMGEEETNEGESFCKLCGQRQTEGVPCSCHTPPPVKSKIRGVADQPKPKLESDTFKKWSDDRSDQRAAVREKQAAAIKKADDAGFKYTLKKKKK